MSRKEIGSEFWIGEVPSGRMENRDSRYVLSGRTAIDLVLQDLMARRPVRRVYMPAYCCDSMTEPFLQRGIGLVFYDICLEDVLEYRIDVDAPVDVLYVNNYFGYRTGLDASVVRRFKGRGVTVVYDRTHSLFLEDDPLISLADYSFSSLRKWTGIVTGAIVTGIVSPYRLGECPYWEGKAAAMQAKKKYLDGDPTVSKDAFLEAFALFGHELAGDYRNYAMDGLSYTLWQQEDFASLKIKRRENAEILHSGIPAGHFIARLEPGCCPLFVPVFFQTKDERDRVRAEMIRQQVYCPVHWPKPAVIPSGLSAHALYDCELSLLCDQRYGRAEMEKILEILKN